jgi:hypothetical protein
MVKWLVTVPQWQLAVPILASAFTAVATTTTAASLLGFFTPTKKHSSKSAKERF